MKVQDELIYQLAMLEVQLQPLQRQVNQSLSHLKTIQYYIDNQGDKIAQIVMQFFSFVLVSLILKFKFCFELKKNLFFRKQRSIEKD